MIKLILQLVMPQQLSFFAEAFAVATFAFGVSERRQTRKRVESAQERQEDIEIGIQTEQSGRERRRQVRQSNILQAQAEALQFSQTAQVGGGTGVASAVSANLSRNLGDISFGLQSSKMLTSARTDVARAGRQSDLGVAATQLQPLIFSNIDTLNTFFDSAFSSDTGTP